MQWIEVGAASAAVFGMGLPSPTFTSVRVGLG